MGFLAYTTTIQENDIAIIYRGHFDLIPLRITRGKILSSKYGLYKHDNFIDKPWGSKFLSHTGKGHLCVLHPTPELWTMSLPHRTQILYIADISLITQLLGLSPGVRVIESGTGSGSFSHAIVRTLAPHGHLYTFEYHVDRAEAVREEFRAHGIDHLVTVKCRDVCESGFDLPVAVDAVFLDLPIPWQAIKHAKRAMRTDVVSRICCFSPCIEQVQRTCDTLRSEGFVDVVMHECLLRKHDVRNISMRSVDSVRRLPPHKLLSAKDEQQTTPESNAPQGEPSLNGVSSTPLPRQLLSYRPLPEQRGHTSYLVFASLIPVLSSLKVSEEVSGIDNSCTLDHMS